MIIMKMFKRLVYYLDNDNRGECSIPFEELEMVAKCLLPDIIKFFEKDENKQCFEQWKSENAESAHLTKKAV